MYKLLGLILAISLWPSLILAPNLSFPDESDYLIIQKSALKANYVAYTPIGTPIVRVLTAYSSTIDQTDNTPFITASGEKVRKGIIATNEFPFGTLVLIDGYIYKVQDRTNTKYKYLIDIWMPTREEALDFGKQIKKVYLLN